jgi:DNA polymerase III beta subunit, central domain
MKLTIRAAVLADIATAAAVAANDKARPMLTAVKLTAEGNTVTATATDSYALVKITGKAEVEEAGEILIAAADLVEFAKLTGKTGEATITAHGSEDLLFSGGGIVTTRPQVLGNYPDVESLMPAGEPNANSPVAFNPALLARFAKVAPWNTRAGKRIQPVPMSVSFYTNTRPAKLTGKGDNVETVALLMPVRIS